MDFRKTDCCSPRTIWYDLEAVSCWLKKYAKNPKTFDAYRREGERLLMWCVLERGLPLGKLKAQDFEQYLGFIKDPPLNWCTTRKALRAGRQSAHWRPFVSGLKDTVYKMAVRIIHSLMNYLVEADYLRANPLRLIDNTERKSIDSDERKLQIRERMLEEDEWEAVQQALEALPESNKQENDYKMKIQFLIWMLYFLGLRIHEVATHGWNAFRYLDGKW